MKRQSPAKGLSVMALFLLILSSSGGTPGGIEKPIYTVKQEDGDFEIRVYSTQIVAETQVKGSLEAAGNLAFQSLFQYISGANRSKTKIAMTAPVGQEQSRSEKIAMTPPVGLEPAPTAQGASAARLEAGGEWIVSFMMPACYTLKTLPEPANDRVRLRVIPAHHVAAVRYSGRWSQTSYEKQLARLRQWMTTHGLQAAGLPVWARYNPPFTPSFLRRNEIHIPLEPKEKSKIETESTAGK